MFRTVTSAVFNFFCVGSVAFVGGEERVGTAVYGVVLYAENVMIPMRDGVRLAADFYRPAENGKPLSQNLPLLLQRTPYNKRRNGLVALAHYFARQGYVVVLQDLRGRYASEGVFTKYIGDGTDGCDTIEWLAKLPYIDGQTGMWGTSYGAHVRANAAKLAPRPLKTIVVNMGGMYNGWDHKIRNHGAFELTQLTWAFRQLAAETRDPVIRQMMAKEDVRDWFTALPLKKRLNPLSVSPNFEDYIFQMMTHSDYDEYWKHPDINWSDHYGGTADIPMLHISGWYDSYCGGTIKNYVSLSKIKKSPIRLLMGPWTHGGNSRTSAGEVDFGADAAIQDFSTEFHLRWFDHFLKGKQNGVEDMPEVKIFVMGTGSGRRAASGRLDHGGYWRTADRWPLPDARPTRYYLHAGGRLSTRRPSVELASTTYTYNPNNPVPTIGGAFSSGGPVLASGAFDQRERKDTFGAKSPYLPLKARHDIVVFQTEPLAEEIEVIGPITVKLYASSTVLDTDFTAKLIDVHPPSADFPSGFEMNLTDGIIRARYRNSREKQELMKPGVVYEFVIEPFPTANVFQRGHRIRLDISSSNFPRFDVNPNSGEPLGTSLRKITADNTIYHDAKHPSHVVLPIARQAGK